MDTLVRTFVDRQGRNIDLGWDNQYLIAVHNGDTIANFDFDHPDEGVLLTHMEVDEAYQRSGIGTEMMRVAEETYGDFDVVDHLSTDGAALMNHCLNGIFQYRHTLIENDNF